MKITKIKSKVFNKYIFPGFLIEVWSPESTLPVQHLISI